MFNLDVIYEDNHIIVVYKPYGVLSQADGSNTIDILSEVKKYIKEKYNKPNDVYIGLVHRLDRNTEGIMVFARTSKAAARLSNDIQKQRFSKEYIAVVEGTLNGDGSLTNYLIKDEKERKAYVESNGKLASLDYQVLNNYKYNNHLVTKIKIKLHTGRFHQIRVQFSNIKHPLYGDIKYGSKNKCNLPVLQAYKLSFYHPTKKELLVFERIDNEGIFSS